MKRLFGLVLVIAVMLTAIALPASAAVDTRTYAYEFTMDFYKNVGDDVGDVWFMYTVNTPTGPDSLTTWASIPDKGTGWVFSYITRQVCFYVEEIEFFSAQDTSISNGRVECYVSLDKYYQPTKTNHFASRTFGGVSNAWDYYHVSQYHGYGLE